MATVRAGGISLTIADSETQLSIGKYIFVPDKQALRIGNEELRLSRRETQLLKMLHKHRNALLERKLALITLWGDDSIFNTEPWTFLLLS